MELTNFANLISEEVSKQLGDGFQVRINNVRKNNNVMLTGIIIIHNDSNITPTVYLNDHYEEYMAGKVTLPDIANHVIDTYNRYKIVPSVDMQYFSNFEDIKERVIYKLVNTEKNKELLEDIPHVEFLDLSIVFQCLVSQNELGVLSVLIHNIHQKTWNISTEDLYNVAMENTPRLLKFDLIPMSKICYEVLKAENPEGEYKMEFPGGVPMFVLSNQNKIGGAGCMLYPDLLRKFSDAIGNNFYIIPSSIHELILLPVVDYDESAELKNSIKKINDTQVSAEEILSYSLYYYDRETGNISKL